MCSFVKSLRKRQDNKMAAGSFQNVEVRRMRVETVRMPVRIASSQSCYCLPRFSHIELLSGAPNAFCTRIFRHLCVSPVRTYGYCPDFFHFLLCLHRVLHCDLFTYWSALFARCSSVTSFKQPTLSHLSHT